MPRERKSEHLLLGSKRLNDIKEMAMLELQRKNIADTIKAKVGREDIKYDLK